MDVYERFLASHAFVHKKAVATADPFNMDYLLHGLTDAQMQSRPHGMNSMAWILWHVARVEDAFVSFVVVGQQQLFDSAWQERLRIDRRDVSTSKDDVAALSDTVDIPALLLYRDAVGQRTREMVQKLWPDRWASPIEAEDVQRAIDAGVCGPEVKQFLPGLPRDGALSWWGLNHTLMHLGQLAMLRAAITADRSKQATGN
jgi:hypothetical protein